MHSFVLTETFQKCIKNTLSMHVPGWTPYPYMGIHPTRYNHTPREPNQVLHGYLLHFMEGKFSRTKVCDIYPLAERAFNFLNMAIFETKSKTGIKTFRNISFMTVHGINKCLIFHVPMTMPITTMTPNDNTRRKIHYSARISRLELLLKCK